MGYTNLLLLVSDTAMPSGVAVAKGVSRAPEPHELNTLLRYRGEKTISYNQLVCALAELALQRASFEFIRQGVGAGEVKPRALSEVARPYFVQFIKLCGLDPVTMKVVA